MNTGRAAGRSYAKSSQRRIEILDAALAVFATSGYQGSSLREVATRAGLSQAGLLHHFGSKWELLAAVLDRRDALSSGFIPALGTGLDYLAGFISIIDYNSTMPGQVELYSQLAAEATNPAHPAHDFFKDRYKRVGHYGRLAYEDLAVAGQLKPGNSPTQLARQLIAVADGLQIQWLLLDKNFSMTEAVRAFIAEHLAVPVPKPHGLIHEITDDGSFEFRVLPRRSGRPPS